MENIKNRQAVLVRRFMMISMICIAVYVLSVIFVTAFPQIFIEMWGYNFEELKYRVNVFFIAGVFISAGIFVFLWLLLKNKLNKFAKTGIGFSVMMWLLIAVGNMVIPRIFSSISSMLTQRLYDEKVLICSSVLSNVYSMLSPLWLIGWVMLLCAYLSYTVISKYCITENKA